MPAAAIRPKMASSMKFLRGAAAGLSICAAGWSAVNALDTYIAIREVRSESALRSRSVFNMNSSGFLRKTQSPLAAASNIAEAAIRMGSVNHCRRIFLRSFEVIAVIYHGQENANPV